MTAPRAGARLLVTGGAGFIGSGFVRDLMARRDGTRIVVLDKLTYAGNRANLAPVEADPEQAARFTFVQGVAITSGLLDDPTANAVMDRLLAKMQSVGCTNFSLGLPGNLVPVRKGDYVFDSSPPERFGVPRLDDGSDGFQFYENGGATGCWAYFTIKALYQLGRVEDARRIFHPMLAGYAAGEFQGFGANGMSRDCKSATRTRRT